VRAVVVGLGGWWFGGAGGPPAQQLGDGRPAFPGLAGKLGDAQDVSIARGGKALTLQRHGDVWGIAQKGGYPAKPDKLHALLAGMADLRLLEPRTSEPGEYAALGVGDPKTDKDALLVRVLGVNQAPIAQVIVGHQRTLANPGVGGAADQVYVRVPDQAQSWLAQGKIDASTDAATWTGEDLTDIKAARMASVQVTHKDASGETVLDFAMKDGKLALVQPAEHPPLDDGKLKDVGQAFEYLIFMDVAKASDQPGTALGDAVFKTTDGLTLTAHVTKAADKVWARFGVQDGEKPTDEAKKLSTLFDGWAYQIGDWKLAALVPTLDQLKTPPPKEAPKPAAETAPETAAPSPASTPAPAPAPAPAAPVAKRDATPASPGAAKAVPETVH
jgi:hypothetical protein